MFKLPIILLFYLNCVHCYKQQQQSNNDYGQHSSAPLPSLPKPKAIIHLPKNVYSQKITDTITLDHNHLSNYLSSINYFPDTIHQHAKMLAQLNPEKYGQSIDQNQLPLISLTVPDENSNSEYAQQMKIDEYSSQQQNYAPQQQNTGYQPPDTGSQKDCDQQQQSHNQPQSNSGYQHEDYKNNQGSNENNDYNSENNDYNSENNDYNSENKSSEEYQADQQPRSMENNYDSDNNYYPHTENSYEGENQQTGDNNNNQNYNSNSNEGNSENYDNSPFDFNFVQDILKNVMQQLEKLQIDPDSLNTYGKVESNQASYEVQGDANGIHLIDKPEEVNYGYSVNHGDGYESNGYASATSAQTTSYTNEPAIVLDNKLPMNKQKGSLKTKTVTYQMPTIKMELPEPTINAIMKAISSKGKNSQPIMIKGFQLPTNLNNLGKIKTIAFIKSDGLPGYFNSQLLGSNLNSLNNYKIVSSSTPSKNPDLDRNRVLSAYGYGISASASSKKASILPLRSRTKRLGYSSSLETASSNLKSSIIAALPKLSKKLTSVSTGSQKTPVLI